MSKGAFLRELAEAVTERVGGEAAPAAEAKQALRLYHGTNGSSQARLADGKQGFDHLSPDINSDQLGLHMGSTRQANSFAGRRPEITDEDIALNPHYYWSRADLANARVVPLDVDVQNPLRLQDIEGHWQPKEVYRQLVEMGKVEDDPELRKRLSELWRSENEGKRKIAMNFVRQMIEDAGHDGVVYLNRVEGIPSGVTYSRTKGLGAGRDLTDDEFRQAVPEAEDSYIVWNRDKYRSPFGDGEGVGFNDGGEVDTVDAYFKRIYG